MQNTKLVLYVEDNPSNVKLIARIFRLRPDLTLHTVPTGEEGLECAREMQPQLILLDVNLPDINGDVVLSRLQASSETARIPVVFLSADGSPHLISRLLEAGAVEYVTKPLDVAHFLSILDRIL